MSLLLQSPALATLPNIRHGFSTRAGGVSTASQFASLNCGWKSGDEIANVAENRRRIAVELGVLPDHLLTAYQVHSPTVITVTTPWQAESRPEADALVTNVAGFALGVLTADCVPILLADPVARVNGAVHAGWRGAVTGVVGNTVTAMMELRAEPARIIAAIGACIWQASYEVSDEFLLPFLDLDVSNQQFFRPAALAEHWLFDLPAFVTAQLQAAGVQHITPSLANTYAEPERFFSFRHNTHHGVNGLGSLLAGIALT